MNLAQRLANYAVGLMFRDLPDAVVHEVKRRVIDSLGCALGAWDAEPCVIARRVASQFSAKRGATLLGTSHRAPPDWAAFANGCLVRYLDFNDTYLSKEPAHPSDNIAPALAVAEAKGATGRELITAIALAYETQCRLCDAASLRTCGWDHVTYVAFSSALAAAKLMRLDVARTRHAINIAGVNSAALRQSRVGELSHWKGCTVADAARRGVFAAMLAREGMTGPAPIFEGQMGFEKLVSGPLVLRIGEWASRRNGDFMIMKSSIKCWPAEYHSQSAIEAALKLRAQISDVSRIDSVRIQSHDAAVDIIGSEPEKWRPTSRETADHSLPYIAAVALADGEVTQEQFDVRRITDPKLLKLVSRVRVQRSNELSARYPEAAANIVTARLHGGRELTARVDYPRGHAKNPLGDAEVETKFRSLAEPVVGGKRAVALLHWLWKLEEQRDLHQLAAVLEVK